MAGVLASLRQWAVEVVLDGESFVIPPRPAVDWMQAILCNSIVDMLPDEAADLIDNMIEENRADVIDDVFNDAVEAASGREWYVAARLVWLMTYDQLRGEVMTAVDVNTAPFGAVLDTAYAVMVRWMDEKKRTEFDAKLNAPALGVGSSDPREQAARMRQRTLEHGGAIGGQSGPRRPRNQPPPENGHRDG